MAKRGKAAAQDPKRLSEPEIDAIAQRLRDGEYLDDQYQDRLFRQPKEYELSYAGKQTRSGILSSTMAVPLQMLRRFGHPTNSWSNKLVFGDNLQVLKTLFEMKERGELLNADGTSGVRLCYIDPPFATRQEFRGQHDEMAYSDKIVGAEFVEFLRKRLVLIHELLSDDGSLFVHLDAKKSHYMKVILDEIFGENRFLNEIVWHYYNKLQGNINRFASNHDVILWYRKDKNPTFHRVQETRDAPMRQQKRAWDAATKSLKQARDAEGKLEYYTVTERLVDDVWRLPYIMPADETQKLGYPKQKPESLLERIITAASGEGDLVMDCFVGSGTTVAVADRLGRRWIGVDCGKLAVYTTQRRLLTARTQLLGSRHEGFDFCTAGLYDNDLLEKLPFLEFQMFCLDLFGCRERAHTISDVPMAGTRKGAPVHVFRYDQTDALMGHEYIESLHARIGSKVSGSVCIVAPVSACDPGLFEDIVQVDKVSYFILRVPYSVIEALHDRGFEHIEQPASADRINDPLDSYGFDFIEVPEVKAQHEANRTIFKLHVSSFMRGGLDPEDFDELPDAGRGDLAMVLMDANYDGELFQLSHWRFADELKSQDWTISLPRSECGERLMVVFLDTHGNERREIVALPATSDRAGVKKPATKPKRAPAKKKTGAKAKVR